MTRKFLNADWIALHMDFIVCPFLIVTVVLVIKAIS